MAKATDFPWTNFEDWLPHWETQADKYTLTDGRAVHARKKLASTNADDAVGRGGITYLQNDTITNNDNRSLWIEAKQMLGYLDSIGQPHPNLALPYAGEQLSDATWIGFAGSLPLVGFEEDEFLEGECNIRNESSQYRAFKSKRAQMYAAAGKRNNTFISYGMFLLKIFSEWKIDGVVNDPTSTLFTQYYESAQAARAIAQGYFDLFWSSDLTQVKTWPNVKFYPETPYTSDAFYWNVMAAECLWHGMGETGRASYVASDLIESLPDSTVPEGSTHNNCKAARRVQNPPGTVLTEVHPQWDYDQMRAHFFIIGLDIFNQIAAWDHMGQRGSDPNTIWNAQGGDVEVATWIPDVQGTPPPYGNPGYTPNRLTWYDYCLCGATWLHKQCDATSGANQKWVYTRFKVGSGAFIEPQAKRSDILFAAKFQRGIAKSRVKDNHASWYYYNPSLGKDQDETVTIDINGHQFTEVCQGGILHVFNETLS